jgi:hypothetical protein
MRWQRNCPAVSHSHCNFRCVNRCWMTRSTAISRLLRLWTLIGSTCEFRAVDSSLADELALHCICLGSDVSGFNPPVLRGVTSSHRIPRHKIASTFLPLSSHYHTHVDARLLRYPEFSHFVAVDRSFATIDLTLCAFPSIRCNAVEGAPW